jgi:hypothetical protein
MIQGSESRISHTVCKWNGSSHLVSFYNTMYNKIQNALPSLDQKHRYDFKRWSQQVKQRKGERNRMNASVTSSFFTNATTSIFSFLAQNLTTTATVCANDFVRVAHDSMSLLWSEIRESRSHFQGVARVAAAAGTAEAEAEGELFFHLPNTIIDFATVAHEARKITRDPLLR